MGHGYMAGSQDDVMVEKPVEIDGLLLVNEPSMTNYDLSRKELDPRVNLLDISKVSNFRIYSKLSNGNKKGKHWKKQPDILVEKCVSCGFWVIGNQSHLISHQINCG